MLMFGVVGSCAASYNPADLIDAIAAADAVAPISELSWLDDPDVWAAIALPFIEVRLEAFELFVFGTILNVESQRYNSEDIPLCQPVVLTKAIEHRFLIP